MLSRIDVLTGALHDHHTGSHKHEVIYRSSLDNLFEFNGKRRVLLYPRSGERNRTTDGDKRVITAGIATNSDQVMLSQDHAVPKVTYALRAFDPRRLCGACTQELREAIVMHGHDLELWHTVDHERRALMTIQRQGDLFKARWAEQERLDRQVHMGDTVSCIGDSSKSMLAILNL